MTYSFPLAPRLAGIPGIVRGRLRGLRRFPEREHRVGQVVGFLAAFVSEPEEVEAGLIAARITLA